LSAKAYPLQWPQGWKRTENQLRDRLRKLVHHFNQEEAWDAALRAQTALVAVDSIGCAQDTNFEAAYP
jgi:hypothetical protein